MFFRIAILLNVFLIETNYAFSSCSKPLGNNARAFELIHSSSSEFREFLSQNGTNEYTLNENCEDLAMAALREDKTEHFQIFLELFSSRLKYLTNPLYPLNLNYFEYAALNSNLITIEFVESLGGNSLNKAIAVRSVRWNKNKESINYLLEKFPDALNYVILIDNLLAAPIAIAALFRSPEIVQLILDKGAEVDLPQVRNSDDLNPWTPLALAVMNNRIDNASLLIKFGANVNSPQSYFVPKSILLMAIRGNLPIDTLKFLISKGADVNDNKSHLVNSPLVEAITLNKLDVLRLLIDSGADVNAISNRMFYTGETPLTFAAAHDHVGINIIYFLLKAGARKDLTNKWGNTPYEVAKENKRSRSILNLLKI